MTQLHDFSPGVLPSGLFWIVKVPESAVTITDDTLHIHLENVPEVDAFHFPPAVGNGISPIPLAPVKVSFDVTYTKTPGTGHRVFATSHDPLSPFRWAGKMWQATNSGTFSVTYDDGSFSASGNFSSQGNFGEMGTERNGSFLHADDFREEDADKDAIAGSQRGVQVATRNTVVGTAAPANAPKLKGRTLSQGSGSW